MAQGAQGFEQGFAQQKGLQFASVKAADDHIRALKDAQLADQQIETGALNLQLQKQLIDTINGTYGIKPTGTISGSTPDEMSAQANGAHQAMAAASPDGKTLPRIQTVNSPIGGGDDPKNHVIDYYTPPTQQELETNPNGFMNFVSEAWKADGKTLTPQMWKTGGGAVKIGDKPSALGILSQQSQGQQDMFMDATRRLYSSYGGKEIKTDGARTPDQIVSMNAGTSSFLHNQVDTYDKFPNPNPTITKLLTAQATGFDMEVERQRAAAQAKVDAAKTGSIAATAPAEAAAAGLKKSSELAAEYDQNTPEGRRNLEKFQQDLIDKRFGNQEKAQAQLFKTGVSIDPNDPTKKTLLNLSTPGADELLVDQRTGQPIPTNNVNAVKPTMQETNRADFAKSTMHILEHLDDLKKQGKLPNGPFSGLKAAELAKLGFGNEDAQTALDLVSLGQSASTGAHVGGRFNREIMDKMNHVININMNDSQFQGAEDALRMVMSNYVRDGGRESVASFKQSLMGQSKVINGKTYTITGFDQNGLPAYDVK